MKKVGSKLTYDLKQSDLKNKYLENKIRILDSKTDTSKNKIDMLQNKIVSLENRVEYYYNCSEKVHSKLNISEHKLTLAERSEKKWKNACHKLIKLLEDIERLNSNETVLELCSNREYIYFPCKITKRSMIEAGAGYNPEDSFNPMDYQV